MTNFEVELRAFLSDSQFGKLLKCLGENARPLEHVRQLTYYLDDDVDTRIEISTESGSLRQKLGMMHEPVRREVEIPLSSADAESMLRIFRNLRFKIRVIWCRERRRFDYDGIVVALDKTIGYGNILEAEITCKKDETHASHERLLGFFNSLGLEPTPEREFASAYAEYLETWEQKTACVLDSWLREPTGKGTSEQHTATRRKKASTRAGSTPAAHFDARLAESR